MTPLLLGAIQHHWRGPMQGMAWGWGWAMMFFWIILLVLLAAVAWRFMVQQGAGGGRGGGYGRAEEILRERYAKGEIDSDTYRRMLDDLRRPAGPPPGLERRILFMGTILRIRKGERCVTGRGRFGGRWRSSPMYSRRTSLARSALR